MKTCEAAHKKQSKAGERELTMEALNRSLGTAGVGSKCGGAIEEVMSADGTKVYGERCSRCGKSFARCQVCSRMFVNLARHLEDKDGNPTDCFAGNAEYRRAKAVKDRMDAMGGIRS